MEYKNIIEVQAKEWFDKVNGNSYFSVKVYLDDKSVATLPFQYGYGSHYEDQAKQALKDTFKGMGIEYGEYDALFRICNDNNIKLVSYKQEKCLKRDVVAFGTD